MEPEAMTALGPRTLKALEDGPQRVLEDLGKYRIYVQETVQDFARRVALIAAQEERGRCARICEDLYSRTIISEDRRGSAIECADAIREGR